MTSPKLVAADGGDKKPNHFYVYAREGEKSRGGYEKEYILPDGTRVFHTSTSLMETHSRVEMTDEEVSTRRTNYWFVIYGDDDQITLARRYAPWDYKSDEVTARRDPPERVE